MKYDIEVSITPLCTCCGGELQILCTESRTPTGPFDRDNPFERKDRRVFVAACEKCFIHRPAVSESEQ